MRAQPLLLFQRSNHGYSGNNGFKTNQITPLATGHNVYSTYSSSQSATMGLGCSQASDEMSNIFYYAIYSISFPKLVFLEVPKEPPDGILSDIIMMSITSYIFAQITMRACFMLSRRAALRTVRRKLRWIMSSKLCYLILQLHHWI